ncbi:hypothetical protein BDV06DRAFT_230128 [Aspergillus oleicola]
MNNSPVVQGKGAKAPDGLNSLGWGWALRSLFTGLLAAVVGWWLGLLNVETALEAPLGFFQPIDKDSNWEEHRKEVKDSFVASWDAYAKYAWGQDRFHPISMTGSQMSPSGLGWIIVDSLDTLMIMNLTTRLSDARKWLNRGLTYDQDQDVNTFETTIRMLGGLLSAHYLSTMLPGVSSQRDYIYLTKAIDLADRLVGAYESRSGIPYASVNIATRQGLLSHADGGASSTAEATTIQLEMKYLSYLTGKEVYWRKAEHVMKVIDDQQMFRYQEIRLGSRGDSYYEYLIKQYLQTPGQEPVYREMWEEALAGIQKHLVTSTKQSSLQFIAELPQGIGGPLSPRMDHLVCFLPGSIALGTTEGLTEREARQLPSWNPQKEQQMQLAQELTRTCWAMYAVTDSGLSPEIACKNDEASWKRDFIIKPLDAHNLQRPETVESLFLMYRVTTNPIYREWGWKIFKAVKKHMVAETLKYLYLLFSPRDLLPLNDVVFNTEAHVLPRFNQTRFQTGWKRRKRP